MIYLKRTWTEFKNIVEARNLIIRFEERIDDYYVWSEDGSRTYFCNVYKVSGNADYDEFLASYKSPDTIVTHKTKSITGFANVTGINQTIVEYTVPPGKIFYLTDIIAGGDIVDRKVIQFNAMPRFRIAHIANDCKMLPFKSSLKVNSGVTIRVKNKVATSGVHIATIGGVLYNV